MPSPEEIANKRLEEFNTFVTDPAKKAKQLVKKITHYGETDLYKDDLTELKKICKNSPDNLMVIIFKDCMKHLKKDHSQVRVSTIKLLDYLFQKSHILRQKLLDEFDKLLELTLAISHKPKVQIKLPPPKKYAALLQELTAKLIHKWHVEFGDGYEKLRYAYKYLKEHRLVDFNRFQVNTREQLIKQQKDAEHQERILTRTIENRLKELQLLRPEIEQLLAKIQSLIDLLVPNDETLNLPLQNSPSSNTVGEHNFNDTMQQHGISNLSQSINIEFSPYVEVRKDEGNLEIVQSLREFKKELINGKLTKLIAIEKTISKRSERMVGTLREIIDLKNRATNVVLKLGELSIVDDEAEKPNRSKKSTLEDADSSGDDDDFDEVQPKEGLETYIPKNLRYEYGLEPINPLELTTNNSEGNCSLFNNVDVPSTSSSGIVMSCNVRLETGKLCPRRDKVKCPFHGKIIPRDHLGVPLNEEDRLEEEKRLKRLKASSVPEWQDPQLLAEIKAATGVDLTMPARGKSGRLKNIPNKSLANPKTCDLTPKQRLQKKLKFKFK